MMVWARLQADVNCNLRRGAWYRLIKAQGLAAVVDVKGTPVAVVRAFLQMSSSPPRKWTVVARAFRAQGWAVDVVRTERPGHGQELATEAVREGAKHVVAVGGDGTVHEVANGLLCTDTDAALGVVPIGSGNDFAKLVGLYGHDPARAVARLVTARSQRVDAGRVLDEWVRQ